MALNKIYHRIAELLRLEETSGGHVVQLSCSSTGTCSHNAQDHVQMAFEYVQGGRLQNLHRVTCIYIILGYSQSTVVSFEFLPSFPPIYQCKMYVIYIYLYRWCMYIYNTYMHRTCLFYVCIKSWKHLASTLSKHMLFKSIHSQPACCLPE